MMSSNIQKWWLYAAMAAGMLWIGGCADPEGLENGEGEGEEEGANAVSFYIDSNTGIDAANTGREQGSPFKTLSAAYRAFSAEPGPVRLVVLSDIDVAVLEEIAAVEDKGGADLEGESGVALENTAGTDAPGVEPVPFSLQGPRVITIAGGGGNPVTLKRNSGDEDSVLEIGGGARVTFVNIKIDGKKGTGGKDRRALKITGDEGGAKTKVTLGNGAIVTGKITTGSENIELTDKDGSGILVDGNAELVMTGNSKVSDCEATATTYAKGAVVVINGGVFTMDGYSAVSGNSAVYGGGVSVYKSTFTMGGNAAVSGNKVTGNGGGVYVNTEGAFTMSGNATVSGNTVTSTGSTAGGGGVYILNGGTFTMNGGTIKNNKISATDKTGNGGGIYIDGSSAAVIMIMNDGAVVSGNGVDAATASGGGIYIGAATVTMKSGASVSGNTATGSSAASGGGINFSGAGSLTITGGTVSGNAAVSTGSTGGGVAQTAGAFVMSGGTIYGTTEDDPLSNTAASGAAYYQSGMNITSSLTSSSNDTIDGEAVAAGNSDNNEGE
jgi:hypothetical protein